MPEHIRGSNNKYADVVISEMENNDYGKRVFIMMKFHGRFTNDEYYAPIQKAFEKTGNVFLSFIILLISSSAFGAVHLLNIFAGAGIGGVLLQVGYSFLIGGMCAIVLLYTRCIWICVALHAIYDFCGYLVPTLGDGIIWDPITVIITTILGLFALIFMTVWLLRINPDRVNELYNNS